MQQHHQETEGQIERLERVLDQLDLLKRGKRCEAMEGLLEESRGLIDEIDDPEVRDVALIGSAQRVEHYEMAAYHILISLAEQLGHRGVLEPLGQHLAEEQAASRTLAQLEAGTSGPAKSAANSKKAARDHAVA
jgi:ferritin-like metal-binding protein YciE